MRGIAKIAEPLTVASELSNIMRRAFSNLRNGRSGPAIVEIPTDMWNEEIGELDYTPVVKAKFGPDPADEAVDEAVLRLAAAFGGTISAEHGIGRAKAGLLHLSRSAGEIAAMRAVRSALDPSGVLNPGVLFT